MAGPAMKTKQHFNTFTTPLFLELEAWVLPRLEQSGKLDPEELHAMHDHLNRSLRCHRCGEPQPSMPALRAHLASCHAPVP